MSALYNYCKNVCKNSRNFECNKNYQHQHQKYIRCLICHWDIVQNGAWSNFNDFTDIDGKSSKLRLCPHIENLKIIGELENL